MKALTISILSSFSALCIFAQTVILPVEEFNSNILVQGLSAPSTVWFVPNYNTPIAWISTGGCPDGRIGYSSSWNDYWGNFVRLPQQNCTGIDTIVLSFQVSHSHFASHINDWCRFYIWADGGFKHTVVSVKSRGTDITYNSGVNGKGFRFTEVRNCVEIEVMFDLTTISNKSDILIYIEPSCGYDNSNVFYVYFDNIGITAWQDPTVGHEEHLIAPKTFQIFPNPASETLTINLSSVAAETVEGSIFNSTSQQVYSFNIEVGNRQAILDIQSLPSGMYYIHLTGSGMNRSSKFILH
jgi:hypothetical protein